MKSTILAMIALCTTYAGISAPPEISDTNIIRITSFKQAQAVLAQCNEKTLVLCDIDLTLTRPVSQLYVALEHPELKETAFEQFPILRKTKAFEYCASRLYRDCPFQLMEPEIATMLRKLKEHCKATVLGLTSRYSGSFGVIKNVPELTSKQLDDLEIQFSPVPNANYPKIKAKLHNGILFCGATSKGDVLKRFLSPQQGETPFNQIVFFDDQEEPLASVIKYCRQKAMPLTPYLYRRQDILPVQQIDLNEVYALIEPIVDSYNKQVTCECAIQ